MATNTARRAANRKAKAKQPFVNTFSRKFQPLFQILGDMQLTINAMQALLIESGAITREKLMQKRQEIIKTIQSRPVPSAAQTEKEAV